MYDRTLEKMKREGHVFGWFTLPQLAEGDETVGRLSWTDEDGAELVLLNPSADWPIRKLDDMSDVYGLLSDNTVVTLPGAAVRRYSHSAMLELTLRSVTLLLGANVEPSDVWTGLTFRTAHLHEWLARTGIQTQDRQHDDDHRVTSVSIHWVPPESVSLQVEGATLTLSTALRAPADYSPEQEFSTSLNLRVALDQAKDLDEIERSYVRPLIVFSTVIADRWDTAIFEMVRGESVEYPVQVLRAGRIVKQREWQPGDNAYLFLAEDCKDIVGVLQNWFNLYSSAGLPLAVFAETLRSGNSYFPGRLIQLVTALQGYCDARLGDGGRTILATLKALRDHAGIDPKVNKCSDENLDLLSQARNYYTHLGTRKGYSPDKLEHGLVKCCRWATALMQSCVLRELGFSVERSAELLSAHYQNWPLPSGD